MCAKFRASRRLCFEETTKIMSPEMHPKSFGTFETFEKRAPVWSEAALSSALSSVELSDAFYLRTGQFSRPALTNGKCLW